MKSIPRGQPPRLWKKGVGAEADAVAGILSWQLGEYPFCCRIFLRSITDTAISMGTQPKIIKVKYISIVDRYIKEPTIITAQINKFSGP